MKELLQMLPIILYFGILVSVLFTNEDIHNLFKKKKH
jgi:hypothetical protein